MSFYITYTQYDGPNPYRIQDPTVQGHNWTMMDPMPHIMLQLYLCSQKRSRHRSMSKVQPSRNQANVGAYSSSISTLILVLRTIWQYQRTALAHAQGVDGRRRVSITMLIGSLPWSSHGIQWPSKALPNLAVMSCGMKGPNRSSTVPLPVLVPTPVSSGFPHP